MHRPYKPLPNPTTNQPAPSPNYSHDIQETPYG
jgi:hypothetical protein